MTTVQTIVTRALRRGGVLQVGETPDAMESADALAMFNEMLFAWKAVSVDIGHSTAALTDTFLFMVPPSGIAEPLLKTSTIAAAAALGTQGTWNASTNTPTLASSTGTEGHYYKVSVAGSTTLDDVTSWVADDYALYTGVEWIKAPNSTRFEGAIAAILAVMILEEYGGKQPGPVLVAAAAGGWAAIQAAFIRAPNVTFEKSLTRSPGRGPYATYTGD